MDKEKFTNILFNKELTHTHRQQLLNAVLKQPILISSLFEAMEKVTNKRSGLAARTLELAIKKDSNLLLPYLNQFTRLLTLFRLDAVIRSSAKIIELLCIEVYIKNNQKFIEQVNEEYLEQFIESSFDWMLASKATAIQAHSMYSLYLIGLKKPWIHKELKLLLVRGLDEASTGYKNRAQKIINAIVNEKFLRL